jgi:dihydroflavonol-4-reductase
MGWKVLVTGTTGRVGHAVVLEALAAGHIVRAMARDSERAREALPADDVEIFQGDLTDSTALARACEGIELVFNAAGLPQQWLRDDSEFDQINAKGAGLLAAAASRADVRRLIHTSTIDVFQADAGERFSERSLCPYSKPSAYERSKQRGEKRVLDFADRLEVVIVNPAGVYGAGAHGSASLQEQLIEPLAQERLPALPPGGIALVHAASLARGQLQAAEHGRPGERYILCDGYCTVRELAARIAKMKGLNRPPPTIPIPIARVLASAGTGIAGLVGRPPPLSRAELGALLWRAIPDPTKAQRELGWHPTPLDDGLALSLNTPLGGGS